MTMTNLTCCKTQELNYRCSFLNDKSIIYIKCFLQTPNSVFLRKPINSPCFDVMSSITSGKTTSPQNWFLYSCAKTLFYIHFYKTQFVHIKYPHHYLEVLDRVLVLDPAICIFFYFIFNWFLITQILM